MINKSDFLSIIQDQKNLINFPLEEIQGVVEEFPFCQPAQLILARKLKDVDSIHFEKQLNKSSAYSSSRRILHEFIHREFKLTEEIEEPLIDKEALQPESTPALDEVDELISRETSTYKLEELPTEVTDPTPQPKIQLNEKLGFNDWLGVFDDGLQKNEDEIDLINRFIEIDPSHVSKPKEIDGQFENLARSSASDLEVDMVTETLAKVFLDQGNKLKAIEIYERLKLKYPEKSSYFAGQIEFLKA